MQLALSFVPLLFLVVLVPIIYAAFVRLSARILRFQGVSFKAGFGFGFAMTVFSLLIRAVTFFFGYPLPIVFAVALALAVNLIGGGWFFSGCGLTHDRHPLGWHEGVQLSGLTFVLLGVIGALFVSVFRRPIA
jgi:hypothetical protein